MTDLFDLEESEAPLIVTLRKRYDDSIADLKAAQEVKDWTGAAFRLRRSRPLWLLAKGSKRKRKGWPVNEDSHCHP